MASALAPSLMLSTSLSPDQLSYEIFTILEKNFLFGYDDPKLCPTPGSTPATPAKATPPRPQPSPGLGTGRVRILSMDGSGRASDALLAAASLVRLETSLRRSSGDDSASIVDFFDVAAGSGAGGVLAAMLFTSGPDGRPLFSAGEALQFLVENCRDGAFTSCGKKKGWLRGLLRQRSAGVFGQVFRDATLRDTLKPVLIPCFDLATGAPFLFSRADALEADTYDFKLSDVCAATCADAFFAKGVASAAAAPVEMQSVDRQTKIVAVGGGVAMGSPTASAITHVLNNKQEFPFSGGVEDLMVVSLGTSGFIIEDGASGRSPSVQELVRIVGENAAGIVDQAISMAFGPYKAANYLRIQSNQFGLGKATTKKKKKKKAKQMMEEVEEILSQRMVDSTLFRGKMVTEQTNGEKLDWFAGELVKEQERRKKSPLPTVVLKQITTPRTSSATTSTIITATPARSSTTTSPSPSPSP